MKIQYVKQRFNAGSQKVIGQASTILDEYAEMGYDLTLRQLYYQFVARDLLENTIKAYKNLGATIANARDAGLLDWKMIKDRTRFVRQAPSWESASAMVHDDAETHFRLDKWKGQETRPEVWIEKDALVGVFEDVCDELDIPLFSCRGYTSQTAMWTAARNMKYRRAIEKQNTVVLHFGDHDPSGMDMTRDIRARLRKYKAQVYVRRIALTMPQVQKYKCPPNPAKTTDNRCEGYVAKYGNNSWELDALTPDVLVDLVKTEVAKYRNDTKFNRRVAEEKRQRKHLTQIADHWTDVVKLLNPPKKKKTAKKRKTRGKKS